MWITVKGHCRFGRYTAHLPADGRLAVPDGISAAAVLDLLTVPPGLRGEVLLFVNGRPFAPDRLLKANDFLVLLEKVAGG